MLPLTPESIILYEKVGVLLFQLGVTSVHKIRAAFAAAGADDATLKALEPKWQALVDDVRRAAGEEPTA